MRLVYTIHDPALAKQFASFLLSQGIENQMEIVPNTDWGNSDYGTSTCKIWVYDEDKFDKALEFVEQFQSNPENPIFSTKKNDLGFKKNKIIFTPPNHGTSSGNQSLIENFSTKKPVIPFKLGRILNEQNSKLHTKPQDFTNSFSLTTFFLALCCLIFVISQLTSPTVSLTQDQVSYAPLIVSPIKKEFLYDYPESYEILDRIVKLYGFEKLANTNELPPEGQFLLKKYYQTPFWPGLYELGLKKLQGEETLKTPLPMFEKIKEGEVWRLFTPSLLHSDILHLVFNMLWLVVLGRQIEQKIKKGRYFLLVILLAIFSNTCQYLMGGPNFLGFSGVVCGMLTFIWMRQKLAPWEGYPLQRSTFLFMMYFILAMFLLQFFSFFLEAKKTINISPGIANTAHLAGALLGLFLGSLNFFSWKNDLFKGDASKKMSSKGPLK